MIARLFTSNAAVTFGDGVRRNVGDFQRCLFTAISLLIVAVDARARSTIRDRFSSRLNRADLLRSVNLICVTAGLHCLQLRSR
jgi:hypothetical protein